MCEAFVSVCAGNISSRRSSLSRQLSSRVHGTPASLSVLKASQTVGGMGRHGALRARLAALMRSPGASRRRHYSPPSSTTLRLPVDAYVCESLCSSWLLSPDFVRKSLRWWCLQNDLHSRYWTYRMEWIPGPQGRILWLYDGAFVWGSKRLSQAIYVACPCWIPVRVALKCPLVDWFLLMFAAQWIPTPLVSTSTAPRRTMARSASARRHV